MNATTELGMALVVLAVLLAGRLGEKAIYYGSCAFLFYSGSLFLEPAAVGFFARTIPGSQTACIFRFVLTMLFAGVVGIGFGAVFWKVLYYLSEKFVLHWITIHPEIREK